MNQPWKPVLEGKLAQDARTAVEAIADALRVGNIEDCQEAVIQASMASVRETPVQPQDLHAPKASLASGAAGIALFWAYLANATQRDTDAERAAACLDAAIATVAHYPMSESLYGGYTGVAWVVEHLNHRFFGGDRDGNADVNDQAGDEDDVQETLDHAVCQVLQTASELDEFDLISGHVGQGIYGLERLPHPAALTCLKAVVERLQTRAVHPSPGLKTWYTPPILLPRWQRELAPNGYYNLGLAHGVPGVIGLLGNIVATGTVPEARPLLEAAMTWLLRQKLPFSAETTFPTCLIEGREPGPSRSAWCYGDPGVAIALLTAARGAQNAMWERQAIDIAKQSARRSPERSGVQDAALCHGAAGLGHIFNRFYQATHDVEFADAARFWLQRALDMRQPDRGFGGFGVDVYEQDGRDHPVDNAGFLMGASGIGLALLAAIDSTEPTWDRVLLTAVP
jgi:lantibiotic biosynthesis protein